MRFTIVLLAGLIFVLSGCTSLELAAHYAKKALNSRNKSIPSHKESNPSYKVGDPYKVGRVWYYPARNLGYDETGFASWYGNKFAGKPTANGEIFDPSRISAAHKTLPLPSVVRVTNLENGRSLVVRINDRGPFVAGRIIDLSREAARLLGFEKKGIARVRVQILADETLRLEQAAREGAFPAVADRSKDSKPRYTAAARPNVSLTSKSNTGDVSGKGATGGVSAIDLIVASRSSDVIQLPPVKTRIWIQVGAFSHIANAQTVVSKLAGIPSVAIHTSETGSRNLYRVRVGPIDDVKVADAALHSVYGRGFDGAKIVLE